jgi:acetyltransferase-like isoleucine patch superfamily enzyme
VGSLPEILRHIGDNVKIGKDAKIWHFTYISNNTEFGDGIKIGSLIHLDLYSCNTVKFNKDSQNNLKRILINLLFFCFGLLPLG